MNQWKRPKAATAPSLTVAPSRAQRANRLGAKQLPRRKAAAKSGEGSTRRTPKLAQAIQKDGKPGRLDAN